MQYIRGIRQSTQKSHDVCIFDAIVRIVREIMYSICKSLYVDFVMCLISLQLYMQMTSIKPVQSFLDYMKRWERLIKQQTPCLLQYGMHLTGLIFSLFSCRRQAHPLSWEGSSNAPTGCMPLFGSGHGHAEYKGLLHP